MSNKTLLIFTDIGDDIDDSLALTYLSEHTSHRICAVIGSHGNIDYRVQSAQELFNYFDTSPPLIVGMRHLFTHDTTQESERLVQEIKQHLPHNEKITILCLCAATDLAYFLLGAPEVKDLIEEIRYQGVIEHTSSGLQPNLDSYNFKTDPAAIAYCLAQGLPCQRITKHDAYKHPFRSQDFLHFTKKADLNEYLLSKAKEWQSRFKAMNPLKRQEVYGSDTNILSYPYDLLVAQRV